MFFNMRDPAFSKTNVPVKQSSSMHLAVVIFNAIFLGCLVLALVGLGDFLSVGATVGIIIGSYLLYLIIGYCCSDIKDYIHNMKRFDNYQETYNNMVRGKAYFKFWIECYHYVTVRTRKGTRQRKVVTHTANELFSIPNAVDESGIITSIQDVTSHVFINYLKRYYFTDDASEAHFVAAFNSFVARNTRDVQQSYTHNYEV